MDRVLTSESVSAGHPDKLCDAISDSILDACIELDPFARVAVETLVKGMADESTIVLAGEVTLNGGQDLDFERIARETAIRIGYDDQSVGMDASGSGCNVITLIGRQSPEIAQGVSIGAGKDEAQGAGDQGIMFGFASNESEDVESLEGSFMPVPIMLSHRLTDAITRACKTGIIPWIRPDGKSQVSVLYENKRPVRITSLVMAVQHDDIATNRFGGDIHEEHQFIESEIIEKIIRPTMPELMLDDQTKIVVNGTGRFILGGPYADAGLTGRKIIVDTYGGIGSHGGGAFSGKDPSKVDRSAAYAARWAAKHVVAAGLADVCEIQLGYAIGVAEPTAIHVDTKGSSKNGKDDEWIKEKLIQSFDFTPSSIIENLALRNPIYAKTAAGGHFGRSAGEDGSFSWERLDSNILASLR
ncbi:MAG: methionine adenosyltransferase [Euryarchaeota archaeon]|nr:methionine adenosyltransferase [Euryarchaeota archaeon]